MNEELYPTIYPADFQVEIPYAIRDQHIYIPGKTRHGKTTQLLHLIMQDIEHGCGVAVLDPKGDLIKKICGLLPPSRVDDCIYLDLDTPVPIDFMGHESQREKEDLVGELKHLIIRGDTTLTRADAILTDLLYSLLAIDRTTLLDVYRFFRDSARHDQILRELEKKDHDLWRRWAKEPVKDEEYKPITTRMTKFIRNPSLAAIFGSPNPLLSIPWVMDNRKILLVDLGGASESASIYGSLLVSKFQQAAFRRHHVHESKRVPFFLFVDEFEEFQTQSFDKIFSMAGGYGLRFVIGNQFIGQLEDRIRRSIFGNAGSFIVFCVGPEDTHFFKHAAHPYDPEFLGLMPPHQAMFKIGAEPPIFKWAPSPRRIDEEYAARVAQMLKKRTVDKYAGHDTENVVELREDAPATNGNETIPTGLLPDRSKKKRPSSAR